MGATPQLAVLSLIFFSIEQAPAFVAETAFWTIPGMGAALSVYLGYLVAVRLWPSSRGRSVAAVSLGTAAFVVATIALAYAVDVAYLAAVAWLRRPRPITT